MTCGESIRDGDIQILQELPVNHIINAPELSTAGISGIIAGLRVSIGPFTQNDPGCMIQNTAILKNRHAVMHLVIITFAVLQEQDVGLIQLRAVVFGIRYGGHNGQISADQNSLCGSLFVILAAGTFICGDLSLENLFFYLCTFLREIGKSSAHGCMYGRNSGSGPGGMTGCDVTESDDGLSGLRDQLPVHRRHHLTGGIAAPHAEHRFDLRIGESPFQILPAVIQCTICRTDILTLYRNIAPFLKSVDGGICLGSGRKGGRRNHRHLIPGLQKAGCISSCKLMISSHLDRSINAFREQASLFGGLRICRLRRNFFFFHASGKHAADQHG